MNSDSYFSNDDIVSGLALPVPTSFEALPSFPRFNQKQLRAAGDLEKSFVRTEHLMPGRYSAFDEIKPLISVHDRMWNSLEAELHKLDRLDICKKLYQKLETILGHMNRFRYQAAADLTLTSRTEKSESHFDLWIKITPFTEGIKFLIEMSIKHCKAQGMICGGAKLDFLIGLSTRIVMLDANLDAIHGQVVPTVITVAPDFKISADLTDEAQLAFNNWRHLAKPHAAQSDRDLVDTLIESMGPKVKSGDLAVFPELVILDRAMVTELGYGFFDWLEYCRGCMDFFGENEFFKVKGMDRLYQHLKTTVGLDSHKMDLLIKDHGLSLATVEDLTRDDMMPMANYERDSRLLRRPLLDLDSGGRRIALIGVETFTVAMTLFYKALQYGTLRLPRMQKMEL